MLLDCVQTAPKDPATTEYKEILRSGPGRAGEGREGSVLWMQVTLAVICRDIGQTTV